MQLFSIANQFHQHTVKMELWNRAIEGSFIRVLPTATWLGWLRVRACCPLTPPWIKVLRIILQKIQSKSGTASMHRCTNFRWYCPKYSLTAVRSSPSSFLPGKWKFSLSSFEVSDGSCGPSRELARICPYISWQASKNMAAVSGCWASRRAANASCSDPAATYKIRALQDQ